MYLERENNATKHSFPKVNKTIKMILAFTIFYNMSHY